MSSFSPPLGCDPKHLSTSWVPGLWQFCSDSTVAEAHLAASLHTCCILASVIRARLSVCWCKSSSASTCTHTLTDSLAPELCHCCHVGKWSEAGTPSKERWEPAEVYACERVHLFTCVYVGVESSRWLSVVLQISCPSTSSWPLGDTCGLSGRCDQFTSFVAALFFCRKQTKLGFWTIAEAWWLLLNNHSAPHLNAQWCYFQTTPVCIVVLS